MSGLRRYGWAIPLVAVAVAGVLVAALMTPPAVSGHGAAPAAGLLAPGSAGSLSHYPWWDPRGWFGGGGHAPAPRTMAAGGGPQRIPVPRQVAAGKPRRVAELTSRRTANTRVYRLSNGELQAAISAGPVNYRDAAGRWQPINTAVRRVRSSGYAFGNTTSSFRSYFGTTAGRLVRFEVPGGGWLAVGLDGSHPGSPRVAGNSVTYPQVEPGTGVQYQVTPDALKESITLASAAAPASYSYTIKVGGGLVPWQRGNGQVVLSREGAGGPPALILPAPFMTSAATDVWSPYGKVWSPRVSQRMAWDPGTHTLRLRIIPDAAWLRVPGRVFPVVIDPTIVIAPTPTDAQNVMIESDTPTTNYDSNYRLSVGTNASSDVRSLLSFPLTSIPSGTSVDSADLRMYYDQYFGSSSSSETIQADQATASWNASTATWSNASNNDGTEGLNEVIADDSDATGTSASGTWPTTTNSSANDGQYRYNQDTTAGDSFTWVPKLTESGNYFVADHYVATSNAATNAPFTVTYSGGSQASTVNQTSGTGGVWSVLGQHPFVAGTAGKVVLGDGPASSTTRVIADAMRWRLWGAAVTNTNAANVWDSFPVRNIVQSWVNGSSPNYGFVVRSATESTFGLGGPRYDASRFAYQGEVATYPQLVVTYGRPSVTLNQITTIHATGADLSWTPYTDPTPGTNTGDDLAEYQVHRSVYQAFTPSGSTLVAPVASGTTSFSDTTNIPTPADSSDPFGNAFYYMVAVKTQDGQVIPGPVELVRLPKAGYTVKIINASGATTLSKAQPTTNEQHLTGQPWLAVGDDSSTFGVTRTVVNYPTMSTAGIPSTATVTDAELKLWGWYNDTNGSATFDAHALTQSFTPSTATWNSASSGTAWTTAGGAFSTAVTGSVSGLTNDPNREEWPVTSTVQGWVNTPTSEHGLLVKESAESTSSPQEQELFLDTSATEPALRPELVVTYLDTTSADTYYVPGLPDHLASAASYTVPVTVTNTTGTTLSAGNWVLSYHWTLPDGTDVSDASNQVQTTLPSDMPAGDTVTINANLTTPDTSSSGNARTAYSIGWDLYNKTTGTWLSGTNSGVPTIAPLNQPASVAQPGSDQLGLEKFYQYTGVNTGSGSALLNNAANGNVVWSYNAFSNPSRGFATFVRLAYNSMDTSDSSMGFGWSLQASSLMRLGTPLDFHPNPNPTTITLTDGDGTSHWFTWNSSTSQWLSPPGMHYYLQQAGTCDPSGKTQNARAWLLTRPDRTQFYFDCQGYQTAVVDNNGNEADFTYTNRNSSNQPIKFLDYITDPSGRQTLTFSYYNKGDNYNYIDSNGNVASGTNLTNPKIIDEVKSITDVSGRTITFLYTTQGLMAQMTDGDGSPVAKTFKFTYDMTQGNKNVKLVSVTDPRGHATGLAYYTAPQDPKFKWSTETIADRLAGTTSFAYTEPAPGQPTGSVQTVVTDQRQHSSTYALDTTGRPAQVTNALGQVTRLAFDSDNNVTSLTEDNGAQTTWTYNPNTGYPLTMKDAQANHDGTAGTTYTYQTGLSGHTADLISLLSPQQRLYTFGYDANGNLTSVTDPDGNASGATPGSYTTKYTYDPTGQLSTTTNADGNKTSYTSYDPAGYPKTITDALGNAAQYGYDSRGNVTSTTDPLQHTSTYAYDVFGRPGQSVVPKTATKSVTTPAPVYDGNDNVTQSTAPTGAVTSYTYDANDELVSKLAPPDSTGTTQPQTTYGYDPAGNLASVTKPLGNVTGAAPGSFTTTYGYDAINELTSQTDANQNTTRYGYDDTGNKTSVTDPLTNLTKQAYNLNHWPTVTTDAATNTTSKSYDLDGKVISATDQNSNTTQYTLDPRGDVTQAKVPHDTSGGTTTYNTTQYVYDQVGNRTQILTPRAVAAGTSTTSACVATQTCPFTYVTQYNADNQVSAQRSAYNPSDPVYNTPAITSYGYDPAGRLSQVAAPPSVVQDGGSTTVKTLTSGSGTWVAPAGVTQVTVEGWGAGGGGGGGGQSTDQSSTGGSGGGGGEYAKATVPVIPGNSYSWASGAGGAGGAIGVDGGTGSNATFAGSVIGHGGDGGATGAVGAGFTAGGTGSTAAVHYDGGMGGAGGDPGALEGGGGGGSGGTGSAGINAPTGSTGASAVTGGGPGGTGGGNTGVAGASPSTGPGGGAGGGGRGAAGAAGAGGQVRLTYSAAAATNVPNVTSYGYFFNGWAKSSTDPWNITTSYDYNDNGQQASRTLTSADGAMTRTMAWAYYPGGQLQSLTDDGVPTGLYSEMADNSDFNNTSPTGTWSTATSPAGYVGYNYATHAAGTGSDTFTWHLNIPKDGNYKVYVAYPAVSGAATNASYAVTYSNGSGGTATATVTKDQTQNTSSQGNTVWVQLGTYAFTQSGTRQRVTLAQNSGGTVVADAVKVVRDNSTDTNTAHHSFAYTYDPNSNLTQINDNSAANPAITKYAMTYDGLDRISKVEEDNSAGSAVHTTTYGYDADSNLTSRGHDSASSAYIYDVRNLLTKETDAASANDPSPQVTTFGYNPLGLRSSQGKPNGNTVTYSYFADGLLQHQLESKTGGATAAEHTYTYNPDGVKSSDAQKLMNADSTSSYLTHALSYSYDPRDRITQVQTDGATTESYTHDLTGNVTSQTVSNTQTTFKYDRDRLLSATTGGSIANYNYDPLGRLDTVNSGATQLQSNTYDGFDNLITHSQLNSSGGTDTTNYTYDPLSRQTSQTVNGGATTQFAYLGLSSQLITEAGGSVPKSYTYTPGGERLSQTSTTGGTTSTGYYSYNDHSDVEALTGSSGTTTSTYGYTAYGQPIASQFTGADKSNVNPKAGTQPTSSYRFNAMRWDSGSGQYDMGFRNYDPGLNQFLSRDMYNGALADMSLSTDSFTGNRYIFGAGNPVTNIELDGHMFPGGGGSTTTTTTTQNSNCSVIQLVCTPNLFTSPTGQGSGEAGTARTTNPQLPVLKLAPPLCGICAKFLNNLAGDIWTAIGGRSWVAQWRSGWDNKPVAWRQNGILNVAMPSGVTLQFGGIKENSAAGKMGEMATAQRLRNEGYDFSQQVTIESPNGTRAIVDFMTRDQAGELGAVETKTGNGALSGPQSEVYDAILKGQKVTPYGQNAIDIGLEEGVPVKVPNLTFDIWEFPDL